MIHPRFKLAYSLFRDNGVIFISIADHENVNLRAAMNEVFGEENFIATIIWQKVFSPKNSATWMRCLPRTQTTVANAAASWSRFLTFGWCRAHRLDHHRRRDQSPNQRRWNAAQSC
jgi:hypothetical protein